MRDLSNLRSEGPHRPTGSAPGRDDPRRWGMLVIAFLAQNLGPGILFGSFGALILASEAHLGTSRAVASLGIGLALLANGLVSPVVAPLIARTSLRTTMLIGAGVSAAGYLVLAVTDTPAAMLAANLLLIGPGIALCGVMPSNALASNWFEEGRGRALGIVNMPVAVMIVPLACVALLATFGLRTTYLCLAAVYLPLMAALCLTVDAPERKTDAPGTTADRTLATSTLLVDPAFWLITLTSALIVGGAISKSAHLAPLMIERGMTVDRAALLLSISGGTGIIGSPLLGWLAEKVGGSVALAVSAFAQGAAWLILLYAQGMGLLIVDAVVVGACAGGYMVSTAVLIGAIYGRENFARVYGVLTVLTLPFVFGAAPLAGYLRDLTGSYAAPFLMHAAAFAMAGFAALVIARRERPQPLREALIA